MSMAKNHFSSNQPYVKNATIIGLIDLLHSLGWSNHVIGGICDELNVFFNGFSEMFLKNIKIDKSNIKYSYLHQQLRWHLIGAAAIYISSKRQNCEIINHILAESDPFISKAFKFSYVINFSKVSIELSIIARLYYNGR